MKDFLSLWQDFWFKKIPLTALGVLRFLLLIYLTFWELPVLVQQLEMLSNLPTELMSASIILKYHPLPFPISDHLIPGLRVLLIQFGLLAALGVFTRPALFLFFLGYLYLAAVQSAWGWHDHRPSLVAQLLLIFTFAPGIEAFSLTRLWQWFFWKNQEPRPGLWSWISSVKAARWGFQLILVLVIAFYMTAGASKLRYGGLNWLDGKTLAFYISGHSRSNRLQQFGGREQVPLEQAWRDGFGLDFYLYGSGTNKFAQSLAAKPKIMSIAASMAILLEIGFVFALFGARLRSLLFISGFMFHLSIYFLMGIPFLAWAIVDLCFIDWRILFRQKS